MLEVDNINAKDTKEREGGVALILVTFIVALASIIVIDLTYSTYIGSRMNATVERSLFAEYLLKSTVNLARVLLKADETFEDGPQDPWALFSSGTALPNELLGVTDPSVKLEIEIVAEKAKVPIKPLVSSGATQPNLIWRGVLVRLFKNLGFDEDKENVEQSGKFKGKFFNSQALVANLVDYMDPDDESYDPGDFSKGIESELSKGTFPNRQPQRLSEISSIPGFTSARMRKLEPYLTVYGQDRIDINLASNTVLHALHERLGDPEIKEILDYRKSDEGPFKNADPKLQEIINNSDVYNEVSRMVGVNSDWFQVLAKVDYGTSTYFMRSLLAKNGEKDLPRIQSVELF